jgi:hypothetical protein
MNKITTACACVLGLLAVAAATGAAEAGTGGGSGDTIQQFDHWGFSIAPEPRFPGDELRLVAVLSPGTTWVPVPLDFNSNEYTVYVHGLSLRDRRQNGLLVQSIFKGGIAEIYGDPSFNAPFRYNTPAGQVPPLDPSQVPARFIDGELVVRFAISRLTLLFYPQAGIGTVAYTDSEIKVIGGWAMDYLVEAGMLGGWHMGGGFTDEPGTVPAGYGYRYDTLFRWESPQAVAPTSWGRIKANFK